LAIVDTGTSSGPRFQEYWRKLEQFLKLSLKKKSCGSETSYTVTFFRMLSIRWPGWVPGDCWGSRPESCCPCRRRGGGRCHSCTRPRSAPPSGAPPGSSGDL